jgi:amino acid transporter
MNTLKLIGKIIFLFFTIIYMILPLCLIIYTKIKQPNFKNLDDSSTIILGIITLICVVINFMLFKSYFKNKT